MKNPVLVVMAAGMGSRYGGLKQIEPVGSQGEALLDFSLYDAYEAGFRTAVIIIKEAIREDFMIMVGKRLERCPMEIRYAYQEMTKFTGTQPVHPDRTKPLGTAHAILCATEQIDGAPFAVINADDYYGKDAYRQIYQYLCNAREREYCMVGYRLGKTVTEHGSVARGVCQVSGDGVLQSVQERTRIEKYPGGIHFTEDGGNSWTELTEDTVVSMNLWGFTADFLQVLQAEFTRFLAEELPANPLKGECLLPRAVEKAITDGIAKVQVLQSRDQWYGVTYAADKPVVVSALSELTQCGCYPDGLWN